MLLNCVKIVLKSINFLKYQQLFIIFGFRKQKIFIQMNQIQNNKIDKIHHHPGRTIQSVCGRIFVVYGLILLCPEKAPYTTPYTAYFKDIMVRISAPGIRPGYVSYRSTWASLCITQYPKSNQVNIFFSLISSFLIIYCVVCFSFNIVTKMWKKMFILLPVQLIKSIHIFQHLMFLVMNESLVSILRLYQRHKRICTKSELNSVECMFEKFNLHRTLWKCPKVWLFLNVISFFQDVCNPSFT